ncbi:uncharacterized protein LOC132631450 [Lycium barbarum]|uniref:uncharacterized protein LOC132631450 n=1 Tax=Lycium barbarum TaxID=112863 RepID=UPI00293F31AA|nr:uncharacterized protein LOC132631450 [Lycium barbarum]
MWDPTVVQFDALDMTDPLICGKLRMLRLNLTIGFTAVYRLHTMPDRRNLWEKLKELLHNNPDPCLMMGDFNAVLTPDDRPIGSPIQDSETKDFREFMLDTGMNDIQTYRREYAWTNNHSYSRIDRAIGNASWMTTYANLKTHSMEPQFSDHSPLKICVQMPTKNIAKQFKFFNCLADYQDFIPLISAAWGETIEHTSMIEVWRKLKKVKQSLKTLNSTQFKGTGDKIKLLRQQLQSVQKQMSQPVHQQSLIEEEKAFRAKLEEWDKIEESVFH